MKKIMALFVVAIFIFSLVPLALAEGEQPEETGNEEVSAEEPVEEEAPAEDEEVAEEEAPEEEEETASEGAEVEGNGKGEKVKTMVGEKMQNRLAHVVDAILNAVEKIKERIEASEMSEEDKAQMSADLDTQVAELEEMQASLGEELTNEEFRELVKSMRQLWKETKPKLKEGVGKLIGAKLGNIIVKVEQLEAKFEKIRDRLAEKGYDVSALDDYLVELSEKMDSARENWESAREAFKEGNIREAHQFQMEARKAIKEAREDIRNTVKEIKGAQKLEAEDEEAEVEEDEGVEEEEEESAEETGEEDEEEVEEDEEEETEEETGEEDEEAEVEEDEEEETPEE